VYQQKVVKEVELMLSDILYQAEPHLLIPGRFDEQTGTAVALFTISETLDPAREEEGALEAYCRLTDSLLDLIQNSPSPSLAPSRALLRRLRTRDLYSAVGTLRVRPSLARVYEGGGGGGGTIEEKVHDEILERFHALLSSSSSFSPPSSPPSDLIHVELTIIHYGKGDRNPVHYMRFYSHATGRRDGGRDGERGLARRVSPQQLEPCLLPQSFCSRKLRVFCKHRQYRDLVHQAFQSWCVAKQQEEEEEEEEDEGEVEGKEERNLAGRGGGRGEGGGGGMNGHSRLI
ncbi:hypothetical protein VYU27_010178, partial [Nannochloropsis oceanica]